MFLWVRRNDHNMTEREDAILREDSTQFIDQISLVQNVLWTVFLNNSIKPIFSVLLGFWRSNHDMAERECAILNESLTQFSDCTILDKDIFRIVFTNIDAKLPMG